jgi:hypothetical protein
MPQDLLHHPRGLHGAQRLVIDGHRARFLHGRRVALDQQRAHAHRAEQVGQRQAGRAGADDKDPRHDRMMAWPQEFSV